MRKDHSKRVLITSTSLAFFVPMTSIFAIVFYYGFLMRHVVTYSPYFTVYFTASFALLACVSALLVHERYGRKQMLKPGWIGMFIANLLIGFGWLYNNVLAFWGIVLYLASYNFSVGTLKWVYIAEVSNINMAAISYFAYWLSCTLIAGILPWTKDDNIYLAFFFFALCSLIWLVTVYFLKETNLPVPDECSREWFDESFLNNR